MTIRDASATARTRSSSVRSARSGSLSTSTSRCTAREASASSRLASRCPRPGCARVPTSLSGAPIEEASNAPSSSAAQSCSPAPNGTNTPSPTSSRPACRPGWRSGPASAKSLGQLLRQASPSSRSGRPADQLGVVGRRHAHDVVRRLRGREGCCARRHAERSAPGVQGCGGGASSSSSRDRPARISSRPVRAARGSARVSSGSSRLARRYDEETLPAGPRGDGSRPLESERRILGQDRPLELLERRPGLDPELFDQRVARTAGRPSSASACLPDR